MEKLYSEAKPRIFTADAKSSKNALASNLSNAEYESSKFTSPEGSASVWIKSVICLSERISLDWVLSIEKLSDSPVNRAVSRGVVGVILNH